MLINKPHCSQVKKAVTTAKSPQIWAIASGKGGVGKSFVAANLSMALAQHEKTTILVDLDLGSANAHTCLGVQHPKTTLSSLFTQSDIDINDLVVYGDTPHLGLISGATDDLQIANLKHFQKQKIMRNLSSLNADYVILDLGAGTSFNTLDFFLFADQALLTVTPEPTSVENSYRFIKCLLARQLNTLPKQTKQLMHEVLSKQKKINGKPQVFSSFLNEIHQQHQQHGQLMMSRLQELKLNLIVNQVLEPNDAKLGPSMKIIFDKYFNLSLNVMGHLYHDMHVIQSLKQKLPYYQHFPQSRNALALHRIAASLISATNNTTTTNTAYA